MTVYCKLAFLVILFFSIFDAKCQSGEDLFLEAESLLFEGKKRKAIEKFEAALTFSEASQNLDLSMRCHLELAELKNNIIDFKEALTHYKSFAQLYKAKTDTNTAILVDSVSSLKSDVMEKEFTLKEKDKSLDSITVEQIQAKLKINNLELEKQKNLSAIQLARNRRNILISILSIGLIISIFSVIAYFQKRKSNKILVSLNNTITQEKEKSENLLLNILPKKVAQELKENGETKSIKYDKTTVLFADLVGFTKFSENKKPEELVHYINYIFSGFDRILSQFKIEKIKTIGDAYLCVSGLPEANENQIADSIECAKQMIEFLNESKVELGITEENMMQIRIGIHCGPLVAGVVGTKKFAYDIWGDTVNIAARMEQSGLPSHINVSQAIYENAPDSVKFEYRGELPAKNKGKLKMYLVKNE